MQASTSRDIIDQTLSVWESRTPRTLSREDARQIIANMTAFLRILDQWAAERESACLAREPIDE